MTNIFCVFASIDVTMNDRGLYSCNLHHLYCHLYETIMVQLNVTKSREYHAALQSSMLQTQSWLSLSFVAHKGRKEQRFWDGHKAVYVVLLGNTAVLPCINRRNVWTDWSDEEEDQQVSEVHDFVCISLILDLLLI